MEEFFDKTEHLISLSFATGAFNTSEAFLLVAYYGLSVVTDQKSESHYFTLENAIKFNQLEAKSASGIEKQYRDLLLSELENIGSPEQEFSYSDQLIRLWAIAFRKQSEELLKSKSKKIDPRFRTLVQEAVS